MPERLLILACFILFSLSAAWFSGIIHKIFQRLKPTHLLIVIIAFGFLARFLWLGFSPTVFPQKYGLQNEKLNESALIQIYSAQIAQNGIPSHADGSFSTDESVGYSYILGLSYRLFGYHPNGFKYFQIVLGGILPLLFYWLSLLIFRDTKTALWTAALTAFYPQNIMSMSVIVREIPFFFFSFLAFGVVIKNRMLDSFRMDLLVAILAGIAASFRTPAIFYPVVFSAFYYFSGSGLYRSLFSAFTGFIMIMLVNSPWAAVTYHYYGKPCFFTTSGGSALYESLNDRATWQKAYLPQSIEDGGDPSYINEKNPVEKSAIAGSLAKKWILKNPVKTFRMALMRIAALFSFQFGDSLIDLNKKYSSRPDAPIFLKEDFLRKISSDAYSSLFLLALGGMSVIILSRTLFGIHRYPGFALILLLFGFWTAMGGILSDFIKYRWFADLIMVFPASFFLVWAETQIKSFFKNPETEDFI